MNEVSFTAGRDNKGAFATGKGSVAKVTVTRTVAPDQSIDILAVLAALQDTITHVPGVKRKALVCIEEARDEAAKPEPKHEEVKSLVGQAMQYVKDAADVSEAMVKLKPHLIHIAAWAGTAWHTWAPVIGLA